MTSLFYCPGHFSCSAE